MKINTDEILTNDSHLIQSFANLDGLKIVYAISHKDDEIIQLSVVSSNPNFQNFEVQD